MSACKRCSANPSCKEPQSKWFGRVKRCKILRVSLFPIREPSQSSSHRHSRPAVCAASEEALCYWCSNLYIRLGYTLSFTVSKHSKVGFHWVSCCWKKGPFRAPWCSYPDKNTRDLCSYSSILTWRDFTAVISKPQSNSSEWHVLTWHLLTILDILTVWWSTI